MGANNGTPSAVGSQVPPQGVGAGLHPVTSVFSRVGAVVAVLGDYAASLITNDSGVAGATVADALDTLAALDTATKEVWFTPQINTAFNRYRTRSLAGNNQFNFSFGVPHDFTAITSLEMILTSPANLVDVNIDLNSSYALDGEDILTNQETDTTNVVSFAIDEWAVMDVSSVFSSLAAGHRCGLNVNHQGIGSTLQYLFVRLRYT